MEAGSIILNDWLMLIAVFVGQMPRKNLFRGSSNDRAVLERDCRRGNVPVISESPLRKFCWMENSALESKRLEREIDEYRGLVETVWMDSKADQENRRAFAAIGVAVQMAQFQVFQKGLST